MPLFSGPIVLSLDHRVKNENSFIRAINVANQGQQGLAKSAAQVAIEQEKLQARLASTSYHVDRLRRSELEHTAALGTEKAALKSLVKDQDDAIRRIQLYQSIIASPPTIGRTSAIKAARDNLRDTKKELAELTPKINTQRAALAEEANQLRYVNIQLAQRVAREKELNAQLVAAAPAQKQQLGFWNSLKASVANTFSSFNNFVNTVERASVTADRLTRSGSRIITMINKISGAITGKPLLDWDKGATKATTSTTNFGNASAKAEGQTKGLAASLLSAANPLKNISVISVAVGTALGHLASAGIMSIINGVRNLGATVLQTATSIAQSTVGTVSDYERSSKALTALVAQEITFSKAVDSNSKTVAYNATEHGKLQDEYDKLNLQITVAEENLSRANTAGEDSSAEMQLRQTRIEEMRQSLAKLGGQLNEMSIAQTAATETSAQLGVGVGNVRDNLDEAAPKAAELLRWIEKLAIQSPFTQEGVKTTFLMLKSFGFAADKAKDMTQALIDWSAATGKSSQDMERVSLALSQIKNLGKLAGQEVLQLAQAGIPVDTILARSMGKTTAEIVQMRQKGLIPAQDAIDAIIGSLKKDWAGAAKDQANTFSGLISSIQDLAPILSRNLLAPMDEATGKLGGLFGAIQPYIQQFVGMLSSDETLNKVREWGNKIGVVVSDFLGKGLPAIGNFFKPILDAAQGFVPRIANIFNQVKNLIGSFKIGQPGAGVKGLFSAIFPGAEGAGNAAGNFIQNLVATIQQNLPKAVDLIRTNFETVKRIGAGVMEFWDNSLQPAIVNISKQFTLSWPSISKTVGTVFEAVKTVSKTVADVFVNNVLPVFKQVVSYVSLNFPIWKQVAVDAFKAVKEEIQPVIDAAQSFWALISEDFPKIEGAFKTFGSTVSQTFGDVSDQQIDFRTSVQSLVKIVVDGLKIMGQWWKDHGDTVTGIIKTVFDIAGPVFGTIITSLGLIDNFINIFLAFWAGDWDKLNEELVKGNNEAIKGLDAAWGHFFEYTLPSWVQKGKDMWELFKVQTIAKVKTLITVTWNNFNSFIYNILHGLDLLLDKGIAKWDEIKESIRKVWVDITLAVKYQLENVRLAVVGAWTNIWNLIDPIIRNIGYTIKDGWTTIVTWVKEKVQMISDFITNPAKRQEMINAAAAWVQGIIDKIREKAGAVYTAAWNLAQQALKALRNAFGIASPSKEGQYLGQNFGQGIANGIISTIPAIRDAMDRLTGPALNVRPPAMMYGDRSGGGGNVSTSTSYNLNMTTQAQSQGVIQDFQIMRAMTV